MAPDILAFYAAPAAHTSPGRHASRLAQLPADPAGLARVVQGLMIHEHVAEAFYGVRVADDRRGECHIRPVEQLLDALLAQDDRPLHLPRPPERRLVSVCRHFALLSVAVLRAHGVPARVRCGFGTYFNPGYAEDHWVCEHWQAAERRWVLLDSQLDEVWRSRIGLGFSELDVPRDRFLVAGDAWERCRRGAADPATFGIHVGGGLRGLWFVTGSLVRDLAALNKVEMLAWDVWGAQAQVNAVVDADRLLYFDRVAELSRAPDASFRALQELYQNDAGLRVPAQVFNAERQRPEPVAI